LATGNGRITKCFQIMSSKGCKDNMMDSHIKKSLMKKALKFSSHPAMKMLKKIPAFSWFILLTDIGHFHLFASPPTINLPMHDYILG